MKNILKSNRNYIFKHTCMKINSMLKNKQPTLSPHSLLKSLLLNLPCP